MSYVPVCISFVTLSIVSESLVVEPFKRGACVLVISKGGLLDWSRATARLDGGEHSG